MGFYIRKSFKIGPLRLNLSKSGLGASVGTKGARLGLSARGKLYRHLGRWGLYHRNRPYGTTGLTYRIIAWVVPLPEQSHMRKEAGHEERYHVRGPR
jgi:hypothetical protein